MRFIILVMLFGNLILSQNAEISGNVSTNDTSSKLVGAGVHLIGAGKGCTSDKDANYKISDIPPGKYKIQCEYIGYKSEIISVNINDNESIILNFTLHKENRPEIKVYNEKQLPKGYVYKFLNQDK